MAAEQKLQLNRLLEWTGFKEPTYLGLDIESTSIIFTELFDSPNGITLGKLGLTELAPETIKNSEVHSEKHLLKGLQRLKQHYQLNNYSSVIAASSKLVTSHYAITPKKNDEKKRMFQAQNEAKKIFPEMYTDLYIDHAVLPDKKADEENKQKLLLIAAHKASLQPMITATNAVELPIKVIDIDYYALERAFQLIKDAVKEETVAILNVEASTTLLAVLEKGELVHHYHQGFTIPTYDKLIRYTLECFEPSASLERNPEKRDIAVVKLNTILENQLTNQLQSTLSTYTMQTDQNKIEKIVLSGRTALIPNIAKLLTEKLGIEVLIINPFKEMKINDPASQQLSEKIGPACLLSCGLAMRNLDDDKY